MIAAPVYDGIIPTLKFGSADKSKGSGVIDEKYNRDDRPK